MYDPIQDGLSSTERTNKILASHNLEAVECGGGGECWFLSVAHQLNKYFSAFATSQTPITNKDVRRDIFKFIRTYHVQEDLNYLEQTDVSDARQSRVEKYGDRGAMGDLECWVRDLRKNAWGNAYTNRMLPFLYNIPIRIWRCEPSNTGYRQDDYHDLIPSDYDWTRTDGFIELVNIGNVHYRSVVPKEGFERMKPTKPTDSAENGMTPPDYYEHSRRYIFQHPM